MTNKWFSRKLTVFALWSILVIVSVIKNISIDTVISFYGFISLTYIGSNVVQKYFEVKK